MEEAAQFLSERGKRAYHYNEIIDSYYHEGGYEKDINPTVSTMITWYKINFMVIDYNNYLLKTNF